MFRQSKVRLQRDGENTHAHIFPLDEPEEIDRDKPLHQERLDLYIDNEIDSASGIVNWAASGMVIILNTDDGYYVPIGYRDAGAPTHPEKLGTPSGIADDEKELLHPRLMGYREALEEILIYNTDEDAWMRPTLTTPSLRETVVDEQSVPNSLYEKWDETENRTTTVQNVTAEMDAVDDDMFTVTHPSTSETNSFSGKMILDKETLNLDLLDVMVVDVSEYSVDALAFYDGEEVAGDLLDRPIYLFSVDEFKQLFTGAAKADKEFQSGRVTESSVTREFDAVPVLRKSHQAICEWFEREVESER